MGANVTDGAGCGAAARAGGAVGATATEDKVETTAGNRQAQPTTSVGGAGAPAVNGAAELPATVGGARGVATTGVATTATGDDERACDSLATGQAVAA